MIVNVFFSCALLCTLQLCQCLTTLISIGVCRALLVAATTAGLFAARPVAQLHRVHQQTALAFTIVLCRTEGQWRHITARKAFLEEQQAVPMTPAASGDRLGGQKWAMWSPQGTGASATNTLANAKDRRVVVGVRSDPVDDLYLALHPLPVLRLEQTFSALPKTTAVMRGVADSTLKMILPTMKANCLLSTAAHAGIGSTRDQRMDGAGPTMFISGSMQ